MDVKRIRTDCNLTQEELAIMIGVTKQTISNWETGKVELKRNHIFFLKQIHKSFSHKKQTPI